MDSMILQSTSRSREKLREKSPKSAKFPLFSSFPSLFFSFFLFRQHCEKNAGGGGFFVELGATTTTNRYYDDGPAGSRCMHTVRRSTAAAAMESEDADAFRRDVLAVFADIDGEEGNGSRSLSQSGNLLTGLHFIIAPKETKYGS